MTSLTQWRYKFDHLFGDASPRRAFNTLRAHLAGKAEKQTNCPKPWMLQVEVTNRCNINCVFCSRHVEELRLGDMDPALMDKVVDLSATAQEVFLFGYGEPLVSRAFYQLLPRLRSSRIGFFTNGMLLDEKLFTKLLNLSKRPFSTIVFSIDGATAETYESIRCKADFARVWRNLEAVLKVREQRRLKHTHVRLEFVAMTRNIRELDALVAKAADAGADAVKVSHLVVWDRSLEAESLLHDPDLCREQFRKAEATATARGIHLDLPKVPGASQPVGRAPHLPPCKAPWTYAMISHDGEVRACCFAPPFVMGNLREREFGDIWNSQAYGVLRKSLNSENTPRPCLTCEERFRLSPSPDETRTYIKLAPRKK